MSDLVCADLFPDHIICEILTRLPAKSIFRFKCVSKRWLSFISSPRFIASYISRYTPSWAILDRAIRVEEVPEQSLSLSLAEPPKVSSFSLSPDLVDEDLVDPRRKKYAAVISGSSGFLLFAVARKRDPYGGYGERVRDPNSFSRRTDYDILLLCNPVTHEWFVLPDPPRLLNHRCAIGLATRAGGPGGVVPDFVVTEYRPLIGSESATLMSFSSESGKWKTKSANYMLGMHLWRPGGVFEFDGHLLWTDMSCGLIVWDDPFSCENVVQCGFIPLPRGCRRRFDTPRLEEERCIGVGGGCIQYLEMVDGGVLKLWKLKHYEEREWSFVHSVSLMDIWSDESYVACGLPTLTPVVNLMHPLEADVAFLVVGDNIFSVNVGKKKVLSCGPYSSLIKCDMPFVLPTWPTSFPPLFLANLAKDRGNDYFKGKEYNGAIVLYSSSIQMLPTAAAYANRAAAYLNIGEYLQAENDCTEALKLNSQYLKAYARRAIARKELGKLKEAEEDAVLCLKLDPGHDEIQKLHTEINSLLEKVTIKGDGEE